MNDGQRMTEPSSAQPESFSVLPLSTQATRSAGTPALSTLASRRAEIDAKQEQVEALLDEAGAEALLLLESANIAWLAGAPLCQGIPDPAEWPALWLTPNQRWL